MDDGIKNMALQKSPPWYAYHRKVLALFGCDDEILIRDLARTGDGVYTLQIMARNIDKATALRTILQPKIDFDGTVLTTNILGPDEDSIVPNVDEAKTFAAAFAGNPLYFGIVEAQLGYCVFVDTILQFYNDNPNDYCGNMTILPADLAREILVTERMHFCTKQIERR